MKYILIIMVILSVTACARREHEQIQYRQAVGREHIYKIIKTDELRRDYYEAS
jgi:hypothetical protein